MEIKLYLRWSDGADYTLPFEYAQPLDIPAGLVHYREQEPKRAPESRLRIAQLHVAVPYGKTGGCWMLAGHNLHVVHVPGRASDPWDANPQPGVTASNLVREPVLYTGPDSTPQMWERVARDCRETAYVWGSWRDVTPDGLRAFAMLDDISMRQADVIHNVGSNLDEDYWPSDPAEQQKMAAEAGLEREYRRAFAASGGAATAGISTPAKRRSSRANGQLGGRPRKSRPETEKK